MSGFMKTSWSYTQKKVRDIDDNESLCFNDLALKNGKEVEILGITLDGSMAFNTHIKNICR